MLSDKSAKHDTDLTRLKTFDKDLLKNTEEYLALLLRYPSTGEYETDGYWGKHSKL